MNYIAEINAFERWLETNSLAPASQLLWYKLMSLGNRCLWQEWITVDNLRLMSLIGAGSEKTLIRARQQLMENELIEFKKGKKGFPNKYKIMSLYCKFYSTNDSINDSTNDSTNAGKTTVETTDINKHKHKQNNIKKENTEKMPLTANIFKPPTVEEVKAYCDERKNNVDSQMFVDFYASKGWLVGKNKMKDWKACVRTWESRDKLENDKSKSRFVNFEQREAQPDEMRELERKMLQRDIERMGL